MKYLFLFTISPVQSFIAQARKTKDLNNGSKILSDLIGYAIQEAQPVKLIFPKYGLESYPNRFIAIVEKENDFEMKNFGDELKKKVNAKFEEYSLFSVKDTRVEIDKLPSNFYEQIRKHLSIQWVAIPYHSEKYHEQFKEIEALLGAVKNVREFEQLEETGRKCSLCGERNMIFCEVKRNDKKRLGKSKFQIKPNWDSLSEKDNQLVNLFNNSIIEVDQPFDTSEGLCSVCFTKRFYKNEEFPSTAEVALKDTINKLEPQKLVDDYKKLLKEYFDYQLFFKENLTKKYFEKQGIPINILKQAKNKLNEIEKAIKENNLKLIPYYAVVMFDGDSMGKWLSGTYLKSIEKLEDFHIKLTESLGKFAKETKSIVTIDKGKVVYAGGEDFLAFINLNYLFDILKQLRQKFDVLVNQGISEYKIDDKNLSFSAGIVIAHYKMPLSEVLNLARKLEKDAKNIDDDKNAFAVAVIKHSGEINKATLKWGEKNFENLEIMSQITNDLANEIFSKSFIKKLSLEFSNINPQTEILKTELKRLLARSSQFIKQENETKEEFERRKKIKIETTTEKIISLCKLDLENLFPTLFISEFISRYLNGVKNEN